jgi:hypothetical protein
VPERTRSKQTIIVGWLTVAAMLLIATVILLIQSPWNDPGPRVHKPPAPFVTGQSPE